MACPTSWRGLQPFASSSPPSSSSYAPPQAGRPKACRLPEAKPRLDEKLDTCRRPAGQPFLSVAPENRVRLAESNNTSVQGKRPVVAGSLCGIGGNHYSQERIVDCGRQQNERVMSKRAKQRKHSMQLCLVIFMYGVVLGMAVPYFRVQNTDYVLLTTMPIYWRCTLHTCQLEFADSLSNGLGKGCRKLVETVQKLHIISTAELEEFLHDPCHGRPKEFQLASMFERCRADDTTGTRTVMDRACTTGLWSRFAIASFICIGCLGMSLLLLLASAYHLIWTIWCLGGAGVARRKTLLQHSGWVPLLLTLASLCNAVMCIIYTGIHASQGDSIMKESLLGVLISVPKGIDGISSGFRLMIPGWGHGLIVLVAVFQFCAAAYSNHLMNGVMATASAMQPAMCFPEGSHARQHVAQNNCPGSCPQMLELAQLPARGGHEAVDPVL